MIQLELIRKIDRNRSRKRERERKGKTIAQIDRQRKI